MNRPGGQIITNPITSVDLDRDIGNFFYDLKPTRDAGVGLTEQTIDYIVDVKGEPDWIREFRKNAYRVFKSKPLPTHWAGDELKEIDFDVIRYYLASGEATKRSWDDVPKEIKQTFERLGIAESERKFLAESKPASCFLFGLGRWFPNTHCQWSVWKGSTSFPRAVSAERED